MKFIIYIEITKKKRLFKTIEISDFINIRTISTVV